MTLYRQLLLFTLILLGCMFAGLYAGELKNTRSFLASQLESHAQDAATSLGLSLTTLMKDFDLPAMEAMVNAVFDRGYYRVIRLYDVEGGILISKTASVTPAEVPSWFTRLIPLAPPQASALIMKGWQQVGSVTVESHPGYAYRALWKSALSTALWFALAGLLVALLGGLGLRRLLRPLKKVEEQAEALCDRQFHLQQTIPRTRELGKVVLAMNRMTARMKELFEEQAAVADSLLQRTYQDQVTPLGNRRYLEAQVTAQLTRKDEPAPGSFLLIQLNDLHAVNMHEGYATGDHLIQDAALVIQQACAPFPNAAPARLGGGDFAIFLPQISEAAARILLETIISDLQQQEGSATPPAKSVAWGGGIIYDRPVDFAQLLAKADSALGAARYRNDRQPIILPMHEPDAGPPRGGMEWKKLLEDTLATQSVILYRQPTISNLNRDEIVHYEILTRVADPAGHLLSAGKLIPTAERLGLMPVLDRLIIERVLDESKRQGATYRLAVNLSPLSLSDEAFFQWLARTLQNLPADGLKLNFEFPEFLAVRHGQVIRKFADQIKSCGHHIGIDHFGRSLMHFGYLQSVLPNYVKIDRAITNELRDEGSDSSFFISTLCGVAHSLEVKVIAEGVETEAQARILGGMHLDAIQGYYFQRPEPFSAEGGKDVFTGYHQP